MASVSRTVDIIFRGQDQLGGALNSVETGLGGIEGEASQAQGQVAELGDEVEGLGSTPLGAIKLLTAAMAALGASVVVDRFIEANVTLERFERTMAFVTGSTEEAAAEFEYIKDVSFQLGLELQSAAQNYSNLAAATRNTALEGEETRRIFEAVSTAASTLGLSSADTSSVLNALTQIVSKGVVSMEELRQQLGERLPVGFKLLADAAGLSQQEFNKLVESGELLSEDYLPQLRAQLEATFGDTPYIEGFDQSVNRLNQSFDELAISLGDTGVFDTLSSGIEGAAVAVRGLSSDVGDTDRSWLGFIASLVTNPLDAQANIPEAVKQLYEFVTGTEDAADGVAGIGDAAGDVVGGLEEIVVTAERIPLTFDDSVDAIEALAKAGEDANKLLKEIGVDPKQLEEPIERTVSSLLKLTSGDFSGENILDGLLVTLDKLQDTRYIDAINESLAVAFRDGKLDLDEYNTALEAVRATGQRLAGDSTSWNASFNQTADGLQGIGDSAEKAADDVAKTALELEKIASNERIKTIEAQISLDIAQVEANAKVAVATIETLGETITSTADLLGDLFNNLSDADSIREKFLIEDQIKKENERRDEQLELQRKLVEAQVSLLRAQADALRKDAPLITVDGDGLQPHLEAIMFEILQAIQVRVNQEGYSLLLAAS